MVHCLFMVGDECYMTNHVIAACNYTLISKIVENEKKRSEVDFIALQ